MGRASGPERIARGRSRAAASWLFAVVWLACAGVHAAEPVAASFALPTEHVEIDFFSAHVQLLEDPAGELTIQGVSAAPFHERFTPATAATANVGFTDSVWWVRFTLRNPADAERNVFLRQSYPLIDFLDFYEGAGSDPWRVVQTGDRRAFSSRFSW